MIKQEKPVVVSKKLSIAALVMSFLSIAILIIGRLINAASNAPTYSYEAESVRHISTVITIAFTLVSLVGLLLSIYALVKALKTPDIYGGKGIAIAALILNGLFSLISLGAIFILFSYAIS